MNKKDIVTIFKNIGFKIVVDEKLGELVEMSPEDAFTFSSITGANYLINQNGVTMKGRSEVFIHRSAFSDGYLIYSPGLFNRDKNGFITEGYSSDKLLEMYPSVFSDKKYILIEDISKNTLSNIEKEIYNILLSKHNPSDYVLFKNYENGNSFEPFLEYLLSINFINKGYLVENQVPWFQQNLKYNGKILQGGIPDFSASKSSFFDFINKYIINSSKGISVNIIPVIKNFKKLNLVLPDRYKQNDSEYELIVCEAKCTKGGAKQGEKQMNKYSEVELASKIYLVTPHGADIKNDLFGEFYIDNYSLKSIEPIKKIKTNEALVSEDQRWLDSYVKMLLLGNLSFSKIIDLIILHRTNNKLELLKNYDATHLLDAIISMNDNDFIAYFTNNL